ncbi:MAG: DEAD/DEAH box helicase [Porticoccaceae bacterium]|nr:DEAD/DEAH box helicase [Porticoccaceae bacterium]
MTSFSALGLHARLLDILGQQQLAAATDVQLATIPLVLAGRDALVCAETGSGKTFAYLLPVLHQLLSDKSLLARNSPYCLILLPTRELADQVFKQCNLLCEASDIRAALISGGQEFRYQAALLRRNPEIIVATPGRLTEHLASKSLDLAATRCLVLDEADRMLDMGFREEVLAIAAGIREQRQSLMLSATLKHRGIASVAASILENPEKVRLSSARQVNKDIRMEMILAEDPAHKMRLLTWLLANETYGRALVFVKTREASDQVAMELRRHNHRTNFLHGEITQDARRKIMAGFREGKFTVLVATDLAARGLDVSDLELVINFDMAHSGEEFVHRAGRTGRAGQQGLVISLVAPEEWNLSASIQRYLDVSFERRKISGLEGTYKGPKKVKASGKAAGTKKKKKTANSKDSPKTAAGRGKSAPSKAHPGKRSPVKPVPQAATGAGKTGAGKRSSEKGAGKEAGQVRKDSGRAADNQGFAPLKRPKA